MKGNMTSRERVLLTLEHKESDRVPFNLTLTVDIYHRLREHLNLPPHPDKALSLWTTVSPGLDLLDAMRVDIYYVGLNPPSKWTAPNSDDELVYDEWGIGRAKIHRDDGSFYYEMVKYPLANLTLPDIEAFSWPNPYDPGRVEGLRERVLKIRRETDKAIMAKFSNSIWEQSWWLYGMENWMVALMINPEIATAIMDKVCQVAIGFIDVGLNAIGDLVDILRLSGEDLGTQQAPMISMDLYNRLVKPHFEKLWSFAKSNLLQKNPRGKMMVHSCGNVRPFIPSWIDMGLDILDPVQPRVEAMEPYGLKKDFGNQLVFHGGIDQQHTLPFGTRQEVMAEVKSYIRALAPGGGYIVAPAHNVQSDVPPANLVTIRDAIEAYGYYPIC